LLSYVNGSYGNMWLRKMVAKKIDCKLKWLQRELIARKICCREDWSLRRKFYAKQIGC